MTVDLYSGLLDRHVLADPIAKVRLHDLDTERIAKWNARVRKERAVIAAASRRTFSYERVSRVRSFFAQLLGHGIVILGHCELLTRVSMPRRCCLHRRGTLIAGVRPAAEIVRHDIRSCGL